ncbi:hypothetical protein ACI6Q2_21065 [Chitinophagaceae bacterium LWZ2-11]
MKKSFFIGLLPITLLVASCATNKGAVATNTNAGTAKVNKAHARNYTLTLELVGHMPGAEFQKLLHTFEPAKIVTFPEVDGPVPTNRLEVSYESLTQDDLQTLTTALKSYQGLANLTVKR